MNQPADSDNGNDVIFFFGAGASIDAGIPDTYTFVEEFSAEIDSKHSTMYFPLERILEIRKKFNEKHYGKAEVDVEQLLVTLEHLENMDDEILLDFYEEKRLDTDIKHRDVCYLRDLLEEFIRKRAIVKEEQYLDYLKELLKFIPPSLEIYSVNYDTCIEQLSHQSGMKYTDGFDIYWNPDKFREEYDIKLLKLHGSVIWYESKTKEYLKIPVQAFIEDKQITLKLITGEDVKPLLIYPMQKWEYIEPLTELQLMFKKRLVDKRTAVLVVVGYSFRDEYIIRMLWDAARANENLYIILINPNAQRIFEEKLRFLDRRKTTPSRIADRVICLPYPFATAVQRLKNHFLRHLSNALRMERDFDRTEKLGQEGEWGRALGQCIECEFLSKAETILSEKMGEDWFSPISVSGGRKYLDINKIVLCFRGLLHSVIAGDEFLPKWLERMNRLFGFTNCENLRAIVRKQDLTLHFYTDTESDANNFRHTFDTIEKLMAVIEEKRVLLGDKLRERLGGVGKSMKRLSEFKRYLGEFDIVIKWEDYFKLRKDSEDSIRKEFEASGRDLQEQSIQNIQQIVLANERSKLKEIFQRESFEFELND